MNRILMIVAAVAMTTTYAQADEPAASLASPTMVMSTAGPQQDWNGFYYGFSLGHGTGSYDLGVSSLGSPGPKVDVQGAMVGLRVGYNIQAGKDVYGFDADLSTGIDGRKPIEPRDPVRWSCLSGDCNVSIDALLTLRGRYGWLVSPDTLIYGAGGLAAARVEGGIKNSNQQGKSTAVGYTVGLGLEHRNSERASFFVEINHFDLGKLDFGNNDGPETFDGKGDFTTVRIGMNFRF